MPPPGGKEEGEENFEDVSADREIVMGGEGRGVRKGYCECVFCEVWVKKQKIPRVFVSVCVCVCVRAYMREGGREGGRVGGKAVERCTLRGWVLAGAHGIILISIPAWYITRYTYSYMYEL